MDVGGINIQDFNQTLAIFISRYVYAAMTNPEFAPNQEKRQKPITDKIVEKFADAFTFHIAGRLKITLKRVRERRQRKRRERGKSKRAWRTIQEEWLKELGDENIENFRRNYEAMLDGLSVDKEYRASRGWHDALWFQFDKEAVMGP